MYEIGYHEYEYSFGHFQGGSRVVGVPSYFPRVSVYLHRQRETNRGTSNDTHEHTQIERHQDTRARAHAHGHTFLYVPALAEAMSEHPRVTYEKGGQNASVDSSRVVFLLVSDVGAEGVNAAVLRYRKRSDVIPVRLRFAFFCRLFVADGAVLRFCC